jgi:broad specificity phosphatase PhoE
MAAIHREETVLVISHGGILMGWFEHVLGLPFRSGNRFRRPHVAFNSFVREEERWVLETWGDLAHLEAER